MRCELVTGVQTCDLPILHDPDLPTVAVVTYRANVLAGNTLPVEQLCDAIEARRANARAVHCYSLRPGADGSEPPAPEHIGGADVVRWEDRRVGTGCVSSCRFRWSTYP